MAVMGLRRNQEGKQLTCKYKNVRNSPPLFGVVLVVHQCRTLVDTCSAVLVAILEHLLLVVQDLFLVAYQCVTLVRKRLTVSALLPKRVFNWIIVVENTTSRPHYTLSTILKVLSFVWIVRVRFVKC
jgi:hypothetical protein